MALIDAKDTRKVLMGQLECSSVGWSNLVNFETVSTDRQINDAVDSLLEKLDEFEQLLELCQSDANVVLFKHIPGMAEKFGQMQDTFEKIDKLEFMVATIKQDVDKMDKLLADAEDTAAVQGGQQLRAFVPFIFNPRSLVDGASSRSVITSSDGSESELEGGGPPKTFNIKQFFPDSKKEEEKEKVPEEQQDEKAGEKS